jgi:amidohydrolase
MMPDPNPVLVNDPGLTGTVTASLERAFGASAVRTSTLLTVAEDYAHIARAVPSVYWWVGVTPAAQDPASAPDNHSDLFFVDEAGLQVGLRSLLHVAVDYLQAQPR